MGAGRCGHAPLILSRGPALEGLVDGRTLVHGHGDPGSPGRVGLLLDGHGRLRILSFAAAPVAPEGR